jgi:hypothetical protein
MIQGAGLLVNVWSWIAIIMIQFGVSWKDRKRPENSHKELYGILILPVLAIKYGTVEAASILSNR